MKVSTDSKKINELLARGVENVYPSKEFLEKELKSGRELSLYVGYDPTAPTLHVGNGITLLKLQQFQELGHKVIFLVGDFTAMIGDPTDKIAVRKKLTREEVLGNCKLYKKQASAILDFSGDNPAEFKFNSTWLSKMNFAQVLDLASHFTVQQMLERDMFAKRLRGEIQCPFCGTKFIQPYYTLANGSTTPAGVDFPNITKCPNTNCGKFLSEMTNVEDKSKLTQLFTANQPIYLHEFLYPLMQGYDSVAMDVDGELGGNDQTFNMLVGRDLMKQLKHKEKFVLTMKILADDSGVKMGKTEGNMVAFSDTPEDMFGKVMRWSDGMIKAGFELCTRAEVPSDKEIKAEPMKFKKLLAYEITKTFLGEKAAEKGQQNFASVIQNKERPPVEEIREYPLLASDNSIISVLLYSGLCSSRTEARRLLSQDGVRVNDIVADQYTILKSGDIIQKGKRFFVKVK